MNGEREFVPSIKESMKMKPNQKFNKGISSNDISRFLLSLKKEYAVMGRNVKVTWRKMQGSRKGEFKHFSGRHVERVVKGKSKTVILFGKAKWNNQLHTDFMKRMRRAKDDPKLQFELFGKRAKGMKTADHAVSIRVGDDGVFMFDNAFENKRKEFSVAILADQMEDICYCCAFDISEE